MRSKTALFGLLAFSIVLILSAVGCNPFWSGNGDISSTTQLQGPEKKASVKFNVVLPPTKGRASFKLPEMRFADTTDTSAKVTFKIVLGNPGNSQQPSYTFLKTVPVTGGTANVTFDAIPAGSVVGLVKIDNGHLSGYTDFIGAKDLVEGANEINVVPAGSGLAEEVVAKVVQSVIQSPDLIGSLNADQKLVSLAQSSTAQTNLEGDNVINDALTNLLQQIKPPTYVYLTRGDAGEILRGYKSGELSWTRTDSYFNAGELWNTDLTQMEMYRILRQGLDGYGFVSFQHRTKSPFAVVRINSATGNREGYVANPGICNHAVVLSDGSVIIGGTNDDKRCPVLFRWNGTGTAQTDSNAESESGLMWARYFTEFLPNATYPSPSVEGLAYDGQTLLCTVRDPANNMQRTFRVDIANGTGDSGYTGVIANSEPFVTLESPAEGSSFSSGSNVVLTAKAYDIDGKVQKVEFYNNETKLGEDTTEPYSLTLTAPAIGNYSVFAKAYDDKDAFRNSNMRTFSVAEAATGVKPVVAFSSPSAGQIGVAINPGLLINIANGGDNHHSTDWEIYASSNFTAENRVWFKANDTANLSEIIVNTSNGTFENALAGKTSLAYQTSYYVRARARNSTDDTLLGDWSSAIFFSTTQETNVAPSKPTIAAPSNLAVDLNMNPQIQTTAFYDTNTNDTHLKTDWEVYADNSLAATSRVWVKTGDQFSKTSIVVNSENGKFENALVNETGLTGQTYYVRARFYDDKNAVSDWSDLSAFTTRTVAIPQNLVAVAADSSVSISWTTVSGAVSYNIYQKSSTGVTKLNGQKSSVDNNSKSFTGLVNGTTYFFKVSAVDQYGNESVLSDEVSAIPFGAPQNVSATAGNTSATISWSMVPELTYNIYYGNTESPYPSGSKIAGVTSPYTVSSLANDTVYYFVVTSQSGQDEAAAVAITCIPTAGTISYEFSLPAGYASVAYPVTDSSANLALANFSSTSEAWLVLINRSAGTLSPSWSAARAVGNVRANVFADASPSPSGEPISDEHRFHLMLRELKNKLPKPQTGIPAIRGSVRAVSLEEQQNFTAYTTGFVLSTFPATCKRINDISGTNKKVYFFLDNDDVSRTGVNTVLDGLATAWANIYATNRTVFGAEPENTLNGLNVNDFYILISSKIYTAGYFYSGDFYPKTTSGVAYSNEKKLFNIQYPTDSQDLNRSITDLSATMAHEFQHMIHFYQKMNLNDPAYWLDEAMSGYAEQVNGYKIENGQNQSKALQAQKYFEYVNRISVNEWHAQNDSNDIINAHYGKAYLFGTWLAQNYGTSGSVQNLLSLQLTEEAAVAAFTGETFDKTAAKFLMAMLVNDSTGGIYGINGLDLTNTYSFGSGWADVTLTGPAMTSVDFSGATSGSPTLLPYTAAYVRISNGNGSALNVSANLPTGVSLFQLRKN
jgi:hypothetical protein